MRNLALGLLGLAAGALAPLAAAQPVIEKSDRLEVNWSTLRVRFFGEAKEGSDGLKGAEKKAWHDGIAYGSEAVRNLNIQTFEGLSPNPEKLSDDAKGAARQIAQSTFSYSTTYFGDGTVRVILESMLPKALETSAIHFRQKEAAEAPMTQYTGLILHADQALKPKAMYQVVDESGAVLFDVKDMAQEAFRKNLMGRWFKRPGKSELADVVGKSPLTVDAQVKDGRFVVARGDWDKAIEGHRSLLVNGTVAIALP
jgi:hypothetical protein